MILKIIFRVGPVAQPLVESEANPAVIGLDELALGAEGVVVGLVTSAALAQRLEDLGFVPGSAIRCRRRAPLGDPRVYELRGSQLCLRNREARAVRIALRG
jgi:ferrous iron transport protein A